MWEGVSPQQRRRLIIMYAVTLVAGVATWVAKAIWGLPGLVIATVTVMVAYLVGLVVVFTRVKRRRQTM